MRRIAVITALATAVAICAFIAFRSASSTSTVAIGQPIRQDDFDYTVVGVAKATEVGMGLDEVRAKGTFYVVTIQVENRAKIVSFRWDPSIARIVDARGREYQFSLDAERALDPSSRAWPFVGHGESRKFLVAFDLPADVDAPALAFSNGILMGDVFDFVSYARARVPLE